MFGNLQGVQSADNIRPNEVRTTVVYIVLDHSILIYQIGIRPYRIVGSTFLQFGFPLQIFSTFTVGDM